MFHLVKANAQQSTRPIVTIGMGNQNIQSLLIVKNKNIVEVFIENKICSYCSFLRNKGW